MEGGAREGLGMGLREEPLPVLPVLDLLLESQAPPLLKFHPFIVKKVKTQQQWVPQAEMQPLPQAVEHSILCSCSQAELVDLSSQFQQKRSEFLHHGFCVFGIQK